MDTDLQVDGEALHREASLETERVKFFCHWEQTLENTPQHGIRNMQVMELTGATT